MRFRPSRAALGLAPFVLAACVASPAPDPSKAPAPPPAAITESVGPRATPAEAHAPAAKHNFGDAISETSVTPLDALVREPGKYNAATVRTEGVVSAVCQKMGCWMEIGDAAGTAHIRMAGHRFFVPRDARGRRAAVQGRVITGAPEVCGAADGCRGAGQAAADAKIEFEATGVELLD